MSLSLEQLQVLNNLDPSGTLTAALAAVAAGTLTINGTANEVTANTVGTTVTLSTPAAFVAPGSLDATTKVLLPSYAKASLPAVSPARGLIYVSDATGAHVTGSLAFSNGTSWIDVTTGIAVA